MLPGASTEEGRGCPVHNYRAIVQQSRRFAAKTPSTLRLVHQERISYARPAVHGSTSERSAMMPLVFCRIYRRAGPSARADGSQDGMVFPNQCEHEAHLHLLWLQHRYALGIC